MAKKTDYDEQALGPRRITEEDWYGLARRDRSTIANLLQGVPIGECVGKVQDHLHEARSWSLLERFMLAMQRALEADRVRDQISTSYPTPPTSGHQIDRLYWEPSEDDKALGGTSDDDEPDLHQPLA